MHTALIVTAISVTYTLCAITCTALLLRTTDMSDDKAGQSLAGLLGFLWPITCAATIATTMCYLLARTALWAFSRITAN